MPLIGQFQPSEFVKIPTVLMLARYFGKPRNSFLTFRDMLIGVGILALPVGLILLEPDAGQAITYFPILAVVLFLSAIRMRLVLAVLILSVLVVPAAYTIGVKTGKIKSYQQERIECNPRSGKRKPTRVWISHVAINRDRWQRWPDRLPCPPGILAEQFEISSRTTYRFYLCSNGREHRFFGMRLVVDRIRGTSLSSCYWSASRARSCRDARNHGYRWRLWFPTLHKCWHGIGDVAGDRCPAALDERRAFVSTRYVHRDWICDQRAIADGFVN